MYPITLPDLAPWFSVFSMLGDEDLACNDSTITYNKDKKKLNF